MATLKNWISRPIIILNAGQKYCRMLQGEHSAILLTFIKLPFVIKIFVLIILEWPLTQVLLYMVANPEDRFSRIVAQIREC